MNWIDQYLANYRGETDEAKECEQFLKRNYKGNPYLPWAFMLRVMFQQDPDATFDVMMDDCHDLIMVNEYQLHTQQTKGGVEDTTMTSIMSPMVGVSVTFLDKTFKDVYPVQDTDYSAPRAVNQNMINKAKQRALARCISMATGIGWKLYEGQDLQFEPSQQEHKPTAQVEIQPAQAPVNTNIYKVTAVSDGTVETTALDLNAPAEIPDPVTTVNEGSELVDFILNYGDKAQLNQALAGLNTSCIKKYGFAFTAEDTKEELAEKVTKIAKPDKFLASIKNKLKVIANA